MKSFPNEAGNTTGESVTPAAYLSLLTIGAVSLYSVPDNLFISPDILIGFSAFTFMVAVVGIKNIHPG